MSLDFEQLTDTVKEMARSASARQLVRDERLEEIAAVWERAGQEDKAVDTFVEHVRQTVLAATQFKPFRGGAAPLRPGLPLNQRIHFAADSTPAAATIIAIDGSQIVPDRHAPFVYYLINIGAIIFHHGQTAAPEEYRRPFLAYPTEEEMESFRFGDAASVSVERDIKEIHTLAELTGHYRTPALPTLAVMDQRLLYVPIGDLGPAFKRQVIDDWQDGLDGIRRAGGWVIGYVDRPGKASVLTLLKALTPDVNWQTPDDLGSWAGLVDAELFTRVLAPGERSIVWVELSHANTTFAGRGRHNEICFFYLNTGTLDQPNIARIDLPRWVAEDEAAVNAIQALMVDQCRIVGRYPYVLARADEIAVVGRQDQADLEFRIARQLDQLGIQTAETAKQQLKGIVRGGKIRHGI